MWVVLYAYRNNLTKESRNELVDWFKKHVELIWKYEGVISSTHAWIPRELEAEFMEKLWVKKSMN